MKNQFIHQREIFEQELASERQRLLQDTESRLQAQKVVEDAQLIAAVSTLRSSETEQQKLKERMQQLESWVRITDANIVPTELLRIFLKCHCNTICQIWRLIRVSVWFRYMQTEAITEKEMMKQLQCCDNFAIISTSRQGMSANLSTGSVWLHRRKFNHNQ